VKLFDDFTAFISGIRLMNTSVRAFLTSDPTFCPFSEPALRIVSGASRLSGLPGVQQALKYNYPGASFWSSVR